MPLNADDKNLLKSIYQNIEEVPFPLTLLFVGASWLAETIRTFAPDLWSVRTLVVEIEPGALRGSLAAVSAGGGCAGRSELHQEFGRQRAAALAARGGTGRFRDGTGFV